ncbi:MAG TPA: DUF5047 domain-containing protein [Solirubrobacteraceae bacterium]|nr:DUF5047 domain-containing protein [Solirubrobacteraceae bacterium]
MRTVTSAFETAVQASNKLATSAEIIDGAGDETTVEIIDGTVTLDQQAAVRGRCDVTIVDDGTLGLVPDSASSLLAPYGNEIRLSRGVTYPDGTTELVSLGVFRIQDAEVTDDPGGMQIRLSGLDRAQRFIDARFEEPYQVTAGTNYATAIEDVLQAAWPDVTTDFTTTALTTPQLIAEEGADRWAFAQEMAKAISMSLYFDGDGTCVLVPDTVSDPVATLAEGEDGVLLTAGRRWTREGTFNRVIATGENTGETAPARGIATDDNSLSPTYYFGPFGKVPRFYASPFLTTDAQAAAAALSILNKELGTTEQVNFGTLVLSYLEPGDVVRITRDRAGISEEDHIVDALTVPLAATGSMTGATRARQVTS